MEAKKPMDPPTYKNGKSHITIAVIGERGCGKTSMVWAASDKNLPHPDDRIATKTFIVDVEVDGKTEKCLVLEGVISLQDEPDARSKWYSESDVVVLCYTGCKDFGNVNKWYEKLMCHMPVIVVQIIKTERKEIRDDLYQEPNFPDYISCFPHQMEGVKEVFQEAVAKVRKREI